MNLSRYIAILTLVLAFTMIVHAQGPTTEPTDSATTTSPKPQDVDPDKWQFQLTPYIWIAGVKGRAGIGNLVVDVDAALTDDNVDLNFGFMGTFEARKNRFVFLPTCSTRILELTVLRPVHCFHGRSRLQDFRSRS